MMLGGEGQGQTEQRKYEQWSGQRLLESIEYSGGGATNAKISQRQV
jgi:hypothetical protein